MEKDADDLEALQQRVTKDVRILMRENGPYHRSACNGKTQGRFFSSIFPTKDFIIG